MEKIFLSSLCGYLSIDNQIDIRQINTRKTDKCLVTCIPPVYLGETQKNLVTLKWLKPSPLITFSPKDGGMYWGWGASGASYWSLSGKAQ